MIYRFLLLSFIALTCFIQNVHANEVELTLKEKFPIECLDRENYDTTDCEKAQQLEQWVKDQDKVPDKERIKFATLGYDLLVEKATGFRIGLHKIKNEKNKKASLGLKMGVPAATKMYEIGGNGCDILYSVNVLKNTPEFIFFNWECQLTEKGGEIAQHYRYYNFDKRYGRLDLIFTSPNYNKTQPTLKLVKGTYKAEWKNYVENGHKPKRLYYDFKIKGNRPEDLECSRTWNEECDLSLQDAPLPPNRYKILDK